MKINNVKLQVVFMGPPTKTEYDEMLIEFENKLPHPNYSVVHATKLENDDKWGVVVINVK